MWSICFRCKQVWGGPWKSQSKLLQTIWDRNSMVHHREDNHEKLRWASHNPTWHGISCQTRHTVWGDICRDPNTCEQLQLSTELLAELHFSPFSLICFAAMVSLESKAAWESRARAIGVPDGFISELRDASLDTGLSAARLTLAVQMTRQSKRQSRP